MKKTAQPTMKDVAREAGVALGTVSRVFNGYAVGGELRSRVEAASRKLGYEVNNYARALKTNRTYTIALLMPSLQHPFFAALTDALTACISRYGYRTILMITNYDPEAEQKCFTLVRQNKADGVIALSYNPDLTVEDGLPIVTLDCHFNDQIPCVSSDNFRGGQLAAEKLTELGCRRLLGLRIGSHVKGEPDLRGAGFCDACQRLGVDHVLLEVYDEETEAPFYEHLRSHLKDGRLDYDGIFCNSDGLAIRICEYLRSQDIQIPQQVQIIGYDGITDFSTGRYICSTIVQPVKEMAEMAVSLLLAPEAEQISGNYRLPVSYAPGGTTQDALTEIRRDESSDL